MTLQHNVVWAESESAHPPPHKGTWPLKQMQTDTQRVKISINKIYFDQSLTSSPKITPSELKPKSSKCFPELY